MAEHFWSNPYFRQFEALLRRLHTLMASGEGDSDEADRVRDAMDEPWRHLDSQEIARLDGLSADLYLVEGDERLDEADPSGRSPEGLLAEIRNAVRLQMWEELLVLLRRRSADYPPDRAALQRAAAYRHLGHLDAAILFMDYAARRKPDIAEYEWSLVELLLEAGRFDEADRLVTAWTRRSALPPVLAIRAATLLVEATRKRASEMARATYALTIDLLERVHHESSNLPAVFGVLGYLLLGHCYQQLDQQEEAYRAYDEGLRRYGGDAGLFTARGAMRVQTDPAAALADFKRAVEGGARLALPYIYVAHDALLNRDYQHCLVVCNQILSLSQNDRVLALALQWMAIARFELGHPADEVSQYFEAALELDPLNEQIRQNLETFRHLSVQASRELDPGARWPGIGDLDPTLVPPEIPSNQYAHVAA